MSAKVRGKLFRWAGVLAVVVIGFSSVALPSAATAKSDACFKPFSNLRSQSFQQYMTDNDIKAKLGTIADACVLYSQMMGGYYVSSATCRANAVKVRNDPDLRFSGTGTLNILHPNRFKCTASGTWKWDRNLQFDVCWYGAIAQWYNLTGGPHFVLGGVEWTEGLLQGQRC